MQFTLATIAALAVAVSAVPNDYGYYPPKVETVTTTVTTTTTYTKPCDSYHTPPPHYKRDDHKDKGTTHKVVVGGVDILAYNPSEVQAKKGDKIIFEFLQLNHTATESDFDNPCKANGEFDTDFVPNPENKPGITREYEVKDDKPHWFYCRQGNHCQQGMVFAVNPTKDATFAEFQAAAKKAPEYTPDYKTPDYKTPDYNDYKTPDYKTPDYKTPDYDDYKTPDYKTPDYKTPDYKTPDYKTPEYKTPEYKTSEYKPEYTPEYKAPEYTTKY